MTSAPALLDDDGEASVATAIMMSHHGLRRDLARFAVALERLDRDPAALHEEWRRYRGILHGHHEHEDQQLLPHLGAQHPALGPVIERLVADHRRIDPLLAAGDRAFAGLPATVDAAARVVDDLAALLEPHLATEEAEVIPRLRGIHHFPPPASDEEAALHAEGFAWSSHGIAAEVLARVDAMLPDGLRAHLPAARAAFQQRHDRVWGPTRPGASRTAIPDPPG
jgi:hypothetical protein